MVDIPQAVTQAACGVPGNAVIHLQPFYGTHFILLGDIFKSHIKLLVASASQ